MRLRFAILVVSLLTSQCKARQENASLKEEGVTGTTAEDDRPYDKNGYRSLKGMELEVQVDHEFFTYITEKTTWDIKPACMQMTQKEGEAANMGHLLFSHEPCPQNAEEILAPDKVVFDLTAFIFSAQDQVPGQGAKQVLGQLAKGFLKAAGYGNIRGMFLFDPSEPTQIIGYVVEDPRVVSGKTGSSLYTVCYNHSALKFNPGMRLADVCSMKLADRRWQGITFTHPTPKQELHFSPGVQESYQERWSRDDGDFDDYDRSANVAARPEQSYGRLPISERMARAQEIQAKAAIYSGHLDDYLEAKGNESLWRRDYRSSVRYNVMESVVRSLSAGR